jgi:histidyl-tRNA synthetase
MLINAPVQPLLLAVIADTAESEADAQNMTTALRSLDVAVFRAPKGNAKRQAEVARKKGASAILYVRRDPDYREHLHLYPISLIARWK